MATLADRMHTATDSGARSSNQQRGRGVYASCLWPTMQYFFLKYRLRLRCQGHSEFNLHSAVSYCVTISSCVAIPHCVGMSLYCASLLVLVAMATPADRMHTATGLGALEQPAAWSFCWYKTRKSSLRLPPCARSKT